jgi:hypothetical protein
MHGEGARDTFLFTFFLVMASDPKYTGISRRRESCSDDDWTSNSDRIPITRHADSDKLQIKTTAHISSPYIERFIIHLRCERTGSNPSGCELKKGHGHCRYSYNRI